MRILHVCSEFFPLLKTGGLADVTGALPLAQQRLGMDTRVLLPAFPSIENGIIETQSIYCANREFCWPSGYLFWLLSNARYLPD